MEQGRTIFHDEPALLSPQCSAEPRPVDVERNPRARRPDPERERWREARDAVRFSEKLRRHEGAKDTVPNLLFVVPEQVPATSAQ